MNLFQNTERKKKHLLRDLIKTHRKIKSTFSCCCCVVSTIFTQLFHQMDNNKNTRIKKELTIEFNRTSKQHKKKNFYTCLSFYTFFYDIPCHNQQMHFNDPG